jgi:hypothetical protein
MSMREEFIAGTDVALEKPFGAHRLLRLRVGGACSCLVSGRAEPRLVASPRCMPRVKSSAIAVSLSVADRFCSSLGTCMFS